MDFKKTGSIVLIVISIVYLLNPTAGLFELLPDNIPLLGNIDETLAFYLLFSSISYLRTGHFGLWQNIKKLRAKNKD